MKKIFLFLLFVTLGITTAHTQTVSASIDKRTSVVSKGEFNSHPIASWDSIPPRLGRVELPSPMFVPCQDSFAVIDTGRAEYSFGKTYLFIGYISISYKCSYNSHGSLLLRAVSPDLSIKEIIEEVKWQDFVIRDAIYFGDKTFVGNYVPVFVEKQELVNAGVFKE